MVGTEFYMVVTNSVMTHIVALSGNVRRNEQLWHTIDIGNMFGPTFGFKDSQ